MIITYLDCNSKIKRNKDNVLRDSKYLISFKITFKLLKSK